MGRAKGQGKTGGSGRKKGTPNKRSLALQERAEALGIDPFEIMLLFAKGDYKALGYTDGRKIVAYSMGGEAIFDDVISADLRQKSAADACQYIHPKRKAIEFVPGEDDKGPIVVNLSLGDANGNTVTLTPTNAPADKTPPKPDKV